MLCPCNFPGKNAGVGVGCHFLLQGIVPTQGSKLCLFHLLDWQVDSLPPSHPSLGPARAGPASPSSVRRNMQGLLFLLWAPGPGFPNRSAILLLPFRALCCCHLQHIQSLWDGPCKIGRREFQTQSISKESGFLNNKEQRE